MKKIILLLFALFLSFSAYCQFPTPGVEGFEGTTGPEALPSTVWNLGTGATGDQWAVFDNGVGTGRWTINPTLPYQGVNAAYMNRVNAGAGNTSLNYLATPKVTIPSNGQLRFWNRTFTLGNNDTFYEVRATAANPSVADQTNPAAYTTLLATYTEDELTQTMAGVQNAFNVYTEKVINLPATMYTGQYYIAFVRRNLQETTTIDGDRWLLDDVQLNVRCQEPTNLATAGVFSSSANLTWSNPGGATSWEIEILPAATAPTGFGISYSGALPYLATTTAFGSPLTQTPLTPCTAYKFYVRAICPGNIPSDTWAGPFNFTTSLTPPICGGTFSDPGGPTGNYANNINGSCGMTTIFPTGGNPGDLVTVTFTSFATQNGLDILSVYDGNVATPGALLGTYSGATLPPAITSSAANGALTFAFVSNATTQGAGWIANVTCGPPPPCPRPAAVGAVVLPSGSPAITPNSINLTWTNVGPGTSWQYIIQAAGLPAPAAGAVGLPAGTNPFLIPGLTPATCYDVYVKADCTSTANGFSLWSNKYNFCTPPTCGTTFTDAGGAAGNYPNNSNATNGTTQICSLTPGNIVTVTFTSFATELGNDILRVYDGQDATFPLIATLSGTALPPAFTGTTASGCLTFVFTSDGSTNNAGWVANVTCVAPPPCQKPTALQATILTANSANLTWTNVGVGTAWEVIAVQCTDPAPTAASAWIPANGLGGAGATSHQFTNLIAGRCYNFYVRTNCGSTGNGFSAIAGPATGTTPVTCATPINLNAAITTTTTATLTWTQPLNPGGGGPATQWLVIVQPAGTGAPLPGATGTLVTGTPTFVAGPLLTNTNYEFYVQAICSSTDSSPWGGPKTFYMSSTCLTSQPFCGDTGLSYTNTTGQPNMGNIGCLFTTPNPAWYFMQVNTGGTLNFNISQTNGGGGGIDVDFIVWGPFTPAQYSTMCSNLNDFPDGNTSIPNNQVACSYSAAAVENFTITGAVAGNFYMVLITNFSNQPGSVTFTQTGGSGNTNCAIVCSVDVGPPTVTLCQGASHTITATASGATGYSWYLNGSTTPIPGQTTSTLTVTQSGTYTATVQCGLNTASDSVVVTFTTPTVPTFTLPATVCQGLPAPTLPTSSSNTTPITGTWSPATVDTSVLGSVTYTFTPDAGQCASVLTLPIAIVPSSVVPTFNAIPNICQGLPAPSLPLASTNTPAITGTWSPATIDTSVVGTVTYTFTPGAGQCATTQTLNVTIDAPSIVPTFAAIPNICQGLPAPSLPGTSTNSPAITGTWSPATISTATVGTFTFTFTPNAGQCATVQTLNVTIDAPSIAPTFTAIPNICQGLPVPSLPATSTNTPAITGTWSPSTISSATVGTFTFTFTPDAGQCATVQTLNVTIDAPSIAPTFTAIPNICQGLPAPSLPAPTNVPAITGSWSPATISTATVGTFTYTFTPDAGQCAIPQTVTVTIDAPSIVPTFAAIPNICQGFPAPALPAVSNNTIPITGTWSPSTIDTSIVGTVNYTFTPDPGQCATPGGLSVTINSPSTLPLFTQIANMCVGDPAPALPTVSNNGGITGTWSPATINTAVAGTVVYTFTPDPNQCAISTTMTITITAPTTPTFTQIAAICQGNSAPALPTVSNNGGITGTWSPASINTANTGDTVYTFTPNVGQCAVQTTMTITVNPTPVVAPVVSVNACNSYTLTPIAGANYYTSSGGVGLITNLTLTTSQTVYVYAQSNTVPNCTDEESFTVTITPSPQFQVTGGCENNVYVLHVIDAINVESATYSWEDPNGPILNYNSPDLPTTISGIYTVTVTVPGSPCTAVSFAYDITGQNSCLIQQGISPNGDGLNDAFDLAGFNVSQLNIFNRYGKTVYSKRDYTNEWVGQSDSGNELPDGTYYYVMERKDGGDTRTGWIYINKEIR